MKGNALSSLNVFNEGKAGVVFGVFHRNSGEAFSPDYATWQVSGPTILLFSAATHSRFKIRHWLF